MLKELAYICLTALTNNPIIKGNKYLKIFYMWSFRFPEKYVISLMGFVQIFNVWKTLLFHEKINFMGYRLQVDSVISTTALTWEFLKNTHSIGMNLYFHELLKVLKRDSSHSGFTCRWNKFTSNKYSVDANDIKIDFFFIITFDNNVASAFEVLFLSFFLKLLYLKYFVLVYKLK